MIKINHSSISSMLKPSKRRTVWTVLLIAVCLLLAACAAGTPSPTAAPTNPPIATSPTVSSGDEFKDLVPSAKQFVDQMVVGNFNTAVSSFDSTMKGAMPEAKLKEVWNQLQGQVGPFKSQLGTKTLTQQGYRIVLVICQFEKSVINVRLVYDSQARIAGLFFQAGTAPDATPQAYTAPSYVKSGSFHEVELTVGSGKWALPGTLTLPKGSGPFPAVVLVHGSGPNDRDESIGPNKVFRDLAWGLSSQGVAVLRYEKRTRAHADQFAPELQVTLTVKEETIDDALLAAQLLRTTAGIDPKRVFVLGHSLGAQVAPRIGQQDPALAGLILLAGPTRPLEDIILDQVTYLNSLSGTPSEAQMADLEKLKTAVARVKDPNLSEQVSAQDLPLNIRAAYWLDLRDYHPEQVAMSISLPLLVLQGERDYQVSPTLDFPAWQSALAGKTNASLKLYPGLNHLFIAGTGKPNPQEYDKEGHVSEEVVNDIAVWIKKN